MSPKTRARLRRARRIALRALLGLTLLVALGVGTVLAALHTPWGREQLRSQVEAILDDAFVGDVSIRRLEGSVFGDIVLRDVVIHDAAGRPAITVDTLTLELALLPLIGREARFDRVVAEGLVVDGRPLPDGRLNLSALTEPSEEPPGWDLVLPDIAVEAGQVTIATADAVHHLDSIDLDAAISIPRRGAARFAADLVASWREPGLPVRLSARVRAGEEVTDIARLEAGVGALAVSAREIRIRGEEVTGRMTVDAPAAGVKALAPDLPLVGDIRIALDARAVAGATAIAIDGAVGGAPLAGAVAIVPGGPRVVGAIRIRDADARSIVEGAITTDLDAAVTIDVGLGEVRRGVATISARGTGQGGLGAALDAVVTLDGDEVRLGGAHLVASADDLGRAAEEVADLRGRMSADLLAHGRIAGGPLDLAVRGEVDGAGLRFDRHRVRRLELALDVRGLPEAPAGDLRLTARSVVVDGRSAGDLRVTARSRRDGAIAVTAKSEPPWKPFMLDVDALVRVGEEQVTIALGEHRLRTYHLAWHGRGGKIAIDGEKVQVARLRTTIARGQLAVDGTYRYGGRRAGDLATSIHLDGVSLAEVDRSLRLPERWSGRVDAQVHVVRRGTRWFGSVAGAAERIVVRDDAPPIDVRAEARLAPDQVRIDATVTGRGVGTATVDVDLAPPRRLEEPAAWARLERDAIRTGRIVIEDLDLAGVLAVAGLDAEVAGRVDGDVTLTASEARGDLRARGITTPALPAPIDADLAITQVDAEAITAELALALRDLGEVHADATVAVPPRPFDGAAWRRLDAEALRGATVRIDDFVLDAKRSRRLGLAEPWAARADLLVEIAPALRDLEVSAEILGLAGGPLAEPVDLKLVARGDGDGATARLFGSVDGLPVVRGTAALPVGLEALWRRGLAAARAAPLDARLTLQQAPVCSLTALFGRDARMVGTIDATVTVAGTLAAPTAQATARLEGVGVRQARLRTMTIDAGFDGEVVTATARGSQDDGGHLHLEARADLDALRAGTAALEARGFNLEPLAQLAPQRFTGIRGLLDADVEVRGLDPETAVIEGTVALAGARLPLGGQVGTLRDGEIEVTLRGGALTIRGEGKIGAGRANLHVDATMDGFLPRRAEITGRVDDLMLISEQQPRINGTVKATVRRAGDRWVVDATTRAARVVIPESSAEPLHEPGLPADMVIIENGKPPPAAIEPEGSLADLLGQRPTAPWLVVRVKIAPVGIETPEFRGKIAGDLTFTVGDDGVAIDGELEATTGSVALFDRRYRVGRATFSFDGTLDPRLDIQLVHEFPRLTMYVEIAGRLSEPELELTSRPATYTEGQLFSFLLGGTPGEPAAEGVRDAASGIAASVASKLVGGYVEEYLPIEIDVLKFEAATASSSAAFTIGKWLSRRLFVAYRHRVDARPDQSTGEAEVEYWLRPDVLVEGIVGDRGHYDADLLWIRRW